VRWGVLVLLATGCQRSEGILPDRVVLVTIDTLRADRVGCYGSERTRTPEIDTLAAGGVRFAAAISPAPLTLPAHASLLTALEPPRHGVRHNSIHRLGAGPATLAEQLRAAGFETAAFVGALVLDSRFGLARGFDVYDDRMERRSAATVGYAERRGDRVVDAALRWLETAPDRFFLWLHLYDPHTRYDPPPGFAVAYPGDPYAGEIAFADAQVGRLLGGIRSRWGSSGLLVALTSDHGESLFEHGEPTHSYTLYEATQRVPLVLAGAGLPEGVVFESPVGLVDVAPTLLAASGAAPIPDADGRDLGPLVRGNEREERFAYMETLATRFDFGWSPLFGIRTRRYKYVRAPRAELYDLLEDPAETINLASGQPERVARLEAFLARRLERSRPSEPIELLPADRARLRSLGYVVPTAGIEPVRAAADGPDPKDEIGLLGRMLRAEELMDRGRAAEALAVLRGAQSPGPALAALRAAIAYNAGDPELAAREARRVLDVEPGRVDVRIVLARALEAVGDAATARAVFDSVVALDPEHVLAWQGVARTAEQLGDESGAEAARARTRDLLASEPRDALRSGSASGTAEPRP
jgi:arylsulfatase A-like enzyme